MGAFLSGVARGLIAALPYIRRGKAEREAGINPASAEDGRADELLNEALKRLGSLAPDDSLMQRVISGVAAIAVRPEHFSKPYVRDWLSLPATRESLKKLSKAQLVNAPMQTELRESLMNDYMDASGEHKSIAEDCVNISVAFLKASMQAAARDAGAAAISQVGFESVHAHLDDVSKSIDVITQDIKDAKSEQAESIESLTNSFDKTSKNLVDIERALARSDAQGILIGELAGADSQIIDVEALGRLEVVIKSRFFGGFDAEQGARRILASLQSGDLVRVSNLVKSKLYAWCARLLTAVDVELAESLVEKSANLGSDENIQVARAFIKAKRGDVASAIELLATSESDLSRSAALMIINVYQGGGEAYKWFEGAGLSIRCLDPDGKVAAVQICISLDKWDVALEFVNELVDSDLISAPALAYLSAQVYLMQVVPSELRSLVLQPPPFDSAAFPLAASSADIDHRRKAIGFYEKTAEFASQLGLSAVANISADAALWLTLRDPDRSKSAISELENSMRDNRHSLRRLPLALQFGVSVDLSAVEREIERQTTLSAGKSTDAAVARLAMAFRQKTPADFLDYIERHRKQLSEQLNPKALGFYEVEMLVRSGRLQRARERIEVLSAQGVTEIEKIRLIKVVDEAEGVDPVEQRVSMYEVSNSLGDLRNLVEALEQQRDWPKLATYTRALFDRTRDLSDFIKNAHALYNLGEVNQALSLLDEYPALLQQSEKLMMLKCWILYELGLFSAASELLGDLRRKNDCDEYRNLTVSIAVASGDWESLQVFVESEWAARNERSAGDLLRIAKLAGHIQSNRLKEIVFEVARRSSTDPATLIGCYSIATENGWESDSEVFSWLNTAASLSDENGPVQKVSLEELLERQPAWENRESEAWKMYAEGKLPVVAVSSLLNRSFFSLYILPALANDNISDVRKRSLIYAFSGSREVTHIEPDVIAFDATSLLTLQMLGLTQQAFDTFSEVVITHGFLSWLFAERQKIPFHQPSKIADANEIRRYVADGSLRVFESTVIPAQNLMLEVGEGLALMLSEAAASKADSDAKSLVVRSGPVHKVGSLVQEVAELEGYEEFLCGCTEVVEELVRKGVLTAVKADECRAYLSLQEQPWPNPSAVGTSTVLFLDDVSVSYFQHLGILQKICRAGFTVYISARELEEADALIEYDTQASEVKDLVDGLRVILRDEILSGKIKVDRLFRENNEHDDGLKGGALLDLMRLSRPVDMIVSDDRFINRHSHIDIGVNKVGISTSVDVVSTLFARGVISEDGLYDSLTKLRRFGMLFIPVDSSELKSYLKVSKVDGGILLEGAELKAVRESYLRAVMSDAVQFPQELVWLNMFFEACTDTLKSLWYVGCDEESAGVKSDWLFQIMDLRKVAHIYKEPFETVLERYSAQITALMLLPIDLPTVIRGMYWRWYEKSVLLPIKERDQIFYAKLVARAAKIIEFGIGEEIREGG